MTERKKTRGDLSRRELLQAAALGAAGASLLTAHVARAAGNVPNLVARPPPGFTPLTVPGKIVKVVKGSDLRALMQPNLLWPKADVARLMVEKALTAFTGAPNIVEAMKKFIHKDDTVAIKVNGIAGQKGYTMAVNFETILPVVEAVIGVGVPPEKIAVYEQYPSFLHGTRVGVKGYNLPAGVVTGFHLNKDATMPMIPIYEGIRTRFVRFLTEASALIDMTQIKDHSIAGYTGTIKNCVQGNIVNPQAHHMHTASPQLAVLYNHPILKSRARVHITDGFKIIYDQGPLDKNPRRRILYGAIFVATDPVAMDTIGWGIIDHARKENGLKSLKEVGREPRYIKTAGEFGLGIHDLNSINMQTVHA
jgi:Domain of unknown function (DUF362)